MGKINQHDDSKELGVQYLYGWYQKQQKSHFEWPSRRSTNYSKLPINTIGHTR